MPIIAHNGLPTFERIRAEGTTVLSSEFALSQDIRELHIGLLNMMPDAALAATERQFFRLIGESNQIAQFFVHPFTLPELPRGPAAAEHIATHYDRLDALVREGLDALVITGANVTRRDLSEELFWQPLIEVIDWAMENVTSVLCSCLATHAVMQFRYGQRRRRLREKRWGVYCHRVLERAHPLVAGKNTIFDVPHSRFNEIAEDQFEAAGLHVLAASPDAGPHLAVSEDGFRVVFFQGHPEYDTISLLKEYKREVGRFFRGERADYPAYPENYFRPQAQAILNEYREQVEAARASAVAEVPPFPEALLQPMLDNSWHDSAESVINNWIGNVYQVTSLDRRRPFKPGVDPADPLGWRGLRSRLTG